MRPLSTRKRRLYVWLFAALFLLSVPLALLYAAGYRYEPRYGFVQTGGIFISVPYSETIVRLNGEEVGRSGILNKNFYIDNLAAATYDVEVVRKGSLPWKRVLVVLPEIVTDADVFLVPESVRAVEMTFAKNAPSTTERITEERFAAYLSLFKVPVATTTKSRLGMLRIEHGDAYLLWEKEENVLPSIYCGSPSSCLNRIVIGNQDQVGNQDQAITNAAFFSGGVVYTTRDGVFITEADSRPGVQSAAIYKKQGADFRVVDNRLIVKDGSRRLYEILDL